ncbi:RNA recognition motif domain-containing protein [Photobacterium sanguinicancri]|uniref:RNA-binding protein n=1 Tax=Photobacterium sanguinicancri TaxID=875932 RepID=A0AAW7Y8Y6_9GAMM|nr:RNA-binding protein [Photobacterium sanguinicancri]KXI22839.1 RNA-binding protein [Photobacterium sanguinicancri]MDO6500229.1 RNA-binding protein [Photobacterium sanguinicancri]MDO6545022.1 RNA-binding protein [Photobacterium sanguinicancri]OZS41473.1 RNA-binding protein [Photobacterium sanguinicancri]
MKLSNQTLVTIIALAVLGALIMSFIAISPSIAFALGVILSGLAVHFMQGASPAAVTPDDSSSTSSSSKTIYVGNLPYRANENDVKDLFSEHGEVFAVRLMKDKRTGKRRGFGFVVMNSADVGTAIANLNNKEYGQRTLKVREANEPKNGEDLDSE